MHLVRIFMMLVLFSQLSIAQVFNTAGLLRPGKLSLGINPVIYTDDGINDLAFFIHGGAGLTRNMDAAVKLAVGNRGQGTLLGADLEWRLMQGRPYMSLTTGFHVLQEAAFDGTLNITYPVNRTTRVYGGADMDISFPGGPEIPFWLFAGAAVVTQKDMQLLFEIEVGLTRSAPNIIGFGLSFYF